MNFNNKNMESLIKTASQKLGTNPEALKAQLENGNFEQLMNSLSPAQAQGVKHMLNNPKMAQKMMENPQAMEMLKKMMSK